MVLYNSEQYILVVYLEHAKSTSKARKLPFMAQPFGSSYYNYEMCLQN